MTRRRKWLVLAFGLAVLAAPLVIFEVLVHGANARAEDALVALRSAVAPVATGRRPLLRDQPPRVEA